MDSSSKSKKPEDPLLQSDVASFVASLGLSSSLPSSSSGFNDSDFSKKGLLKPSRSNKDKQQQKQSKPSRNPKEKATNFKPVEKATNFKPVAKTSNFKPVEKATNFKPVEKATNFKPSSNQSEKSGNKRNYGLQMQSKPLSSSDNKYKNIPSLPLVKASSLGVWHVDAVEMEEKVLGSANKKAEFKNVEDWKRLVEKKKQLGERLLAQYTLDYESSHGQNADLKMLIATQRSGTASDKVSAFSVLVGENPIANLKSLDALLGMVASKVGKRHALTGFEVLKELFISSLLPDRKLKTLIQRPLHNLPESKDGYSLLLFWYWEDMLKQRYERFCVALEEASRDVLAVLKDKALKTLYVLLKSKPEQERRLLIALVNKLGDPENKTASNADFHLSKLLSDHPNMKAVVIDEVDTFLFRPHLGLRAKYHAVNFLSQIRLTHRGDGPKVAKRLIDVYFALFKVLISEADGGPTVDKGKNNQNIPSKDDEMKNSSESRVEMDSRLLSALLTGINRAFPFVSSDEADDIVEVQTPMLFHMVHSKNFNVGLQALMLLDRISSKNQIVSDRFYRALYSKLLLPAALISSKEEMFIGLLLRAMKNDISLRRVAAFAKRVLQIALQQPPQYACGCLFLLSEVLKVRPPLWKMAFQSESQDEEMEHFEDVIEEADNKSDIAKADAGGNENSVDVDSDFMFDEDDTAAISSSEDDVSDEVEDRLCRVVSDNVQEPKATTAPNGPLLQPLNLGSSFPGGYNPRHREPSYCNGDRVSWWELIVLASHVHPSVATMAKTILSGANIVYNGNPLKDLALSAFLDKFMEKKPKQSAWHGGSDIEPAQKLDTSHQLIGAEILSLAETDVPPEDLVFHKFYINKMNSTKKSKKKKKKKGAEDEGAEEILGGAGDDESDNEEIEGMLDSADPDLDADDGYDYDDLDKIAGEEDADITGDVTDDEMDADICSDEDDENAGEQISDEGRDDLRVGDTDNEGGEELELNSKKGKRKRNPSASPFASLEEYEHLMAEEDDDHDEGEVQANEKAVKGKKPKTKKRR